MVTSRLPIMDHKLICQWLGLPAAAWPPDHYTLLGLPPGEGDNARIEQHVQERLARLRCYQLSHPEQATEAMNCLAKAFVCLSDAGAKRTYDVALGLPGNGHGSATPVKPASDPKLSDSALKRNGPSLAVPAVAPPAVAAAAPGQVLADWSSAPPPPVRVAVLPEAPPVEEAAPPAAAVEPAAPPPPPAETPAPAAPPVSQAADPVLETATASWVARRGLGTRRALYERLLTTRELLRRWDQLGRYLGRPKRPLARPAEAADLTRRLRAIDHYLVDFPPILGQPGQPGYRVVMLAGDEDVSATFRKQGPLEREALALDWKIGRTVLLSHLRFVRQEVRSLRRQPWMAFFRPVSFVLDEYISWVIVVLLGLSLLLALYLWL